MLPLIRRLVDGRPTYGYRRIAALLNREAGSSGLPPANRKRVHRIVQRHALLLERHSGRREGRLHDGKVAVMRSNLCWCSDALEFACWDSSLVRVSFIIDAFDREIIASTAVSSAGISGSDVRDMMLAAVEKRFGTVRAPHPAEHLSENGSPYTAKETRDFAVALNLVPCFTPVRCPESNGLSEAFVKTITRDYVRISPFPDADRASADRRMDRGLQRDPSSFVAQNALPAGVHSGSGSIAGLSGETGVTPTMARSSPSNLSVWTIKARPCQRIGTSGDRSPFLVRPQTKAVRR